MQLLPVFVSVESQLHNLAETTIPRREGTGYRRPRRRRGSGGWLNTASRDESPSPSCVDLAWIAATISVHCKPQSSFGWCLVEDAGLPRSFVGLTSGIHERCSEQLQGDYPMSEEVRLA